MNNTRWSMTFTRAWLCSLALALVASCGGGDDPPPPANQVGPAGGTVTGPNGTQVVVPAGALSAPVLITITPAAARPLPPGMQGLGSTYDLGPAGTSFALPVTVTLPLDPAQVPASAPIHMLHELHVTGVDAWEALPGLAVGATSVSAQTTSFSHVTLTLGNSPPSITRQPANVVVTAPSGASFSVAFTGTPGFDVQWERSNDGGATWTNAVASQRVNAAPGSSALILGGTSAAAAAMGGDNGALFRAAIRNLETLPSAPVLSNVVTLTVTGAAPTTAPLAVTVVGSGSVTSVPAGIDCGADCGEIYALNTAVTLTPTAAAGFGFSAWSGDADCSDGVLTMSAARACTATFAATPPATTAAGIAAGSDFSLARRANGDLYSWGSDAAGTLGAGNGDQSRNVPGLVLANNIASVAAGGSHGLATRGTGEVRGWGYNGFGQLGDGANLSREAPVSATVDAAGTTQFSDAVEVCGGTLHSLVRRSNGAVHAMGNNSFGQLGDGSIIERRRSVPVSGIGTAIAIACSGNHSLALLADGTVRQWGLIYQGLPGGAPTVEQHSPVAVAGLSNVIAIAAGSQHSLALRSDGSVWAWGSNVNGKLGDGTETDRLTPTPTLLTSQITAIAAGYMNSLARRSDGVVLSWGINETGQLGSGSLSPGYRPQPAPVTGLSDVVAIAFGTGGLGHGLAVRGNGTVWAWGHNASGQLGNGSTAPFSATPVEVTGLNLN